MMSMTLIHFSSFPPHLRLPPPPPPFVRSKNHVLWVASSLSLSLVSDLSLGSRRSLNSPALPALASILVRLSQ